MINKIKISTIIVFSVIAGIAIGQQADMRDAYKAMNDLQFTKAAELYKKAITKMEEEAPQKRYATFMLAECYRYMNNPDQAGVYYESLIDTDFGQTNPILFYRYAEVLRTQGKITEARSFYDRFLQAEHNSQAGKVGRRSCDWIEENKSRRAQVNVSPATSLNSPDDDFSPVFIDSAYTKVVITSNRSSSTGKDMDQWTAAKFSDLFVSQLTEDQWSEPALLERNQIINTEENEGTPSFLPGYRSFYFTRCEKTGVTRNYCKILKTQWLDSTWSEPEVIFADTTANIGQPVVSKDELKIIFSSDMKGGMGGKDLWMARRDGVDKKFGKPTNLGHTVNSMGDDMFPYLFNDTLLFFSSDGFEGYGGLDIYKTIFRNKSWSRPQNVLWPINSGYDDFGIIFKVLGEEGYFCSNRQGGSGKDDIYQFTRRILQFSLSGHVKDAMTLLSIDNAEIYLVSDQNDTIYAVTNDQGKFYFDESIIKEGRSYDLTFRKDNYLASKDRISTVPFSDDHHFVLDVLMEPIPEKPIVLPDILYALDDWTLQPQYQDSLLQLIQLLNDNPNLVIELRSHTDSRASYEYNDELSQKRAQSVVDFLITRDIDPDRLVARGYGERVFRVLTENITRENYLFPKGTELNDDYVYSLPTKEIQEAAFQLNRRTEFAVLARDYKPSGAGSEKASTVIKIISDSTYSAIEFELLSSGGMKTSCYLNDYGAVAVICPDSANSYIDEVTALQLLKKGAINRNDFRGDFEKIMVDDHIVNGSIILIKNIRMGDVVLANVEFVVQEKLDFPVIFAESVLSKAGNYYINKNTHQIIYK